MLCLNIPKEITIILNEKYIIIKGPLGVKKKKKSKELEFRVDPILNQLWISNQNLKQKHFYLSLLNKLIWGVWKGFSIKLNIVGVGYKAFVDQQVLTLKIGFSHSVFYKIPKEVTVTILNKKILTLLISGNDFQKITQVAAQIRLLKPVEPYKGKGIKYFNEIGKKKIGKKTNV